MTTAENNALFALKLEDWQVTHERQILEALLVYHLHFITPETAIQSGSFKNEIIERILLQKVFIPLLFTFLFSV
jgi:hypothetical protein